MAGLRMRILVDSSTFIALAKIINYEGDANARRFAESNGLKFTGLIGLLVVAVKTKRVERENFSTQKPAIARLLPLQSLFHAPSLLLKS
ncbi:hypothetical protein C5S32_10845 [ANME-1 cluster archaeon GoMg1]|nr:hypothetical protein [ANME-1 cluster archaeon GoMg1]